MKTIKQIKQLVEHIAVSTNGKEEIELINSVRDNFLPQFQFNIDASSSEMAQNVISQIAEKVSNASFAPYLPDGRHTIDKVGDLIIETPTIMEWQSGQDGQNFVINYTEKTKEKAQARLNQLIVDMLLSLPGRCVNLHFVDLALTAQTSFLTRNLDEKLYGKLITNSNDWSKLKDLLRNKTSKSLEEYGDVAKYNESKNSVVVPYDVVVIADYKKCLNDMRDLDPLFENGHKGGIYFVLMNNQDFKNDKDIDSLLAMNNSYQVLEASDYGNYNREAFIHCSPILDNPRANPSVFVFKPN